MAGRRTASWWAGASAGLLLIGFGGSAFAQPAASNGTPPPWDVLVRCARIADDDARVACYDTAMRQAGYAPDPQQVAAEHRKHFGLSIPQLGFLKRHSREEGEEAAAQPGQAAPPPAPVENPNEVTLTIDQVALTQPGDKLVLFTTEGQIWQQVAIEKVNTLPKAGDPLHIKKGMLGAYLCDVNKFQSVRCKRTR